MNKILTDSLKLRIDAIRGYIYFTYENSSYNCILYSQFFSSKGSSMDTAIVFDASVNKPPCMPTIRQTNYIGLLFALAKRLKCNITQGPNTYNKELITNTLTTNVESLLKLLSRGERAKLLLDEDIRIRDWIKRLRKWWGFAYTQLDKGRSYEKYPAS